jgi:hypothetical protein
MLLDGESSVHFFSFFVTNINLLDG